LGVGSRGRDEEDAFGESSGIFPSLLMNCQDMRKPLSRDPGRRSVRANGRDMIVDHTTV
jgi:N-terminal acetyltransferase B complex catalytic subunit